MNTTLEKDKTCYTLNGDGTLEKWFFSGYTDDGEAVLRKDKSRKWIQPWKWYPPNEVYGSRHEANKALKERVK